MKVAPFLAEGNADNQKNTAAMCGRHIMDRYYYGAAH